MEVRRTELLDAQGAYDLAATFALQSMGREDPCLRLDQPHRLRCAMQSPAGPVAIVVNRRREQVHVELAGTGCDWLGPQLPQLLGIDYRPPPLDNPRKLVKIARQYAGLRLMQLPSVSLRLVQIILQQLVSFRDACSAWRNLVRRYGTRVPGEPDLWFPPTPRELSQLTSYQFIECGVLPRHGRTIVESMRTANRLETIWDGGRAAGAIDILCDRLRHVRGIGPWSVGFLRGAGLGDADAQVLGDYGHPKQVAYFFTGQEHADDAEMLRLLAPYRPYRFHVLTLLILGAPRPPRRGPRRASIREQFLPPPRR